jgi:hypothetical protein
MQAYWSVPEADQYVVAEAKTGKSLLYTNSGGAIFQVYGSQFRLILKNDGDTTMKIQQVIVFSRFL